MAPGASHRPRRRLASLWLWLALAAATLAVLWPLGLTNRVLAGIDAYTYFTPYWAYRMAALRGGHIPLWNPYLFLGVPFLANPQAGVLYPLHWPLSWLDPAQALVWSALLHTWLAAGFAYLFGRRSLGLTHLAAALTGLLFGLGGYTLARIENINQLNALAWFPALLWLYDATLWSRDRRHALRWGLALAAVMALVLLAGHTQTAFLDLAGLALYAVVPAVQELWEGWRRGPVPQPLPGAGRGDNGPTVGRGGRFRRLLPLLAILPALLLAAAQLWPTWELNNLGLRTGGLPFRQAISFSLRPRLLAQSLLPPLGGGLGETFGSEGYAEFVGYLSIVALMLAGLGLAAQTRPEMDATKGDDGLPVALTPARQQARRALPWLAAAGLLLALGAYDPLYYLLWRFVPGFALFRAPARWLALYVVGMAGLAGVGMDRLAAGATQEPLRWGRRGRIWVIGAGLALVVVLALTQQWPQRRVVVGWLSVGLAGAGLWWLGRARPGAARQARAGLFVLVLLELWLGSRALPFTQATAPAAVSGLRNAPAALLAATAGQPPAGRDRFLSLSDIRFDPGDLVELRDLQAGLLPADATERFVRAAKQLEVLAPNLSLWLRLPAVDGYDGGLLPLARYVKLQSLFFPPGAAGTPSPDGRLREQLRAIPPDRLLDLTGTRYVITDKQNDLWAGDIYYDLEQPVTLTPGVTLTLDLAGYPRFSATGLGIVSYLTQPVMPGTAVARVELSGVPDAPGTANSARTLILTAGADTAWAQATAVVSPTQVARPWPTWQGQGQDYLTVKDLTGSAACAAPNSQAAPTFGSCALTPQRIHITALPLSSILPANTGAPELVLRGLSLIDRRTGSHQSLTLAPRGDVRRIYSGDVKIYERQTAPGRAWLVHSAQAVPDDAAALARLADPEFDPRTTAIVTAEAGQFDSLPTMPAGQPRETAGDPDRVETLVFEPERVVLAATTAAPALLVLADAAYPGWTASVDGQPARLWTTNLMFRGVLLPPGRHEVTLTYHPASWQGGLLASLLTLALCILALALTLYRSSN